MGIYVTRCATKSSFQFDFDESWFRGSRAHKNSSKTTSINGDNGLPIKFTFLSVEH